MIEKDWPSLCNIVADSMRFHTRPFVTPLIQDVIGKEPEVGTGTYIDLSGCSILTCQHVAILEPFLHQFHGGDNFPSLPVKWRDLGIKFDVAVGSIPDSHWRSAPHQAQLLGLERFAPAHRPVDREMLFFRGISGENVTIGNFHSRVTPTAYCSQEIPGGGDATSFDIHWEPSMMTVTSGTAPEVAEVFKHYETGGFSGSLVWNTRFVELGCNLSTWSPNDAVVTGMLHRWDKKTRGLIAWRVEHLREWIGAV